MKISEAWLREWVDVKASTKEIAERLVMAGLELEVEPVTARALDKVVVGRIDKLTPHPQADKLRIAEVDVGSERLQIVCGAANAREGMLAPVALVGAALPGGVEIKQAKLRGADSSGMLCSAKELALAEKSEGLLELDRDAVPGSPIAAHLRLADGVLALEITPNRGDCLSVRGLAREIGALYDAPVRGPQVVETPVSTTDRVDVRIDRIEDCPGYAGRVVRGIDPQARTPDWMREKLRRAGIRSIHPVVDVTNYVMLELGQPMHAFDLSKITGGVRVRRAQAGETLRLLNDQEIALVPADLMITDDRGPLALAGVMGGAASEVSADSTTIFLESACFAPAAVAGAGRRYKLTSDAAHRFERGVDPAIQRESLERATQLLLELCGGQAGPIVHEGNTAPAAIRVGLRHVRLLGLVGHSIEPDEVERLLRRLGIEVVREGQGAWSCVVPTYRYDLRLEVDLIEEVARLYGYDRIPARAYLAALAPAPSNEKQRSMTSTRGLLAARGWQEVVTYSFVDAQLQAQLEPGRRAIPLDNPIADNLSVMRTTLWGGLISAWRYNAQRQQKRVQLFELAVCFEDVDGCIVETSRLAGLAAGTVVPEQWGSDARDIDFFDVKGDLQALLGAGYRFERGTHPALHPGRTARIFRDADPVGWLGTLHPALVQGLDLADAPVLFEMDWNAVSELGLPRPQPLSEFPASRRDLAPVLGESVESGRLLAVARAAGGPTLRETRVLSVYRGEALGAGFKSIALGLIFQDYSRTLTDTEIDAAVEAVRTKLEQELGATFRS